jgi:hypothetical protein
MTFTNIMMSKRIYTGWVWWYMPVIPDTGEVEIGRIVVGKQP